MITVENHCTLLLVSCHCLITSAVRLNLWTSFLNQMAQPKCQAADLCFEEWQVPGMLQVTQLSLCLT